MEHLAVYIPIDRRQALAHGQSLPEYSVGAGLFADISGFTPLTEMLARVLGVQRGAEELTVYLNQVYDALIQELHRYGGSLLTFSGDAITCWFADDDGRRAVATALAMQSAMRQFSELTVPGGGAVALAVKTAVTKGSVRRFVLGNPDEMVLDAIAGQTVARLATAEHQAEKGDVIVDAAVVAALGDDLQVLEWRIDEHSGERFAAVGGLNQPVAEKPWPVTGALTAEQVRPWLLPPVYKRLQRGQGEFLAELRSATALFLRFTGLEYEDDPEARDKLNKFMQAVMAIFERYEGSLLQLTIGDKGSYFYGAFGAPLAHEDDLERAAAAALDLQALPEQFPFLNPLQIGLNYGRMRVGAYGGVARRTYGILGDSVNLAARLMQAAQPGEVLVSDAFQSHLTEKFLWEGLPPMRVKGKSDLVVAHRLLGRRTQSHVRQLEQRYALPMVGRAAELDHISQKLSLVQQGQGQIVALTAEAGMGKSRLVAEVLRLAEGRGLGTHMGEAQSYGTRSSYLVWNGIGRGLLGLDANAPVEQQIEVAAAELRQLDPALFGRFPLLGKWLNLPIPENELTSSLDAKLRKTSLENLVVEIIQAKAAQQPLLLVLDDCHWLDPMSMDLLGVVGRAMANWPVLFLLVYRPLAPTEAPPVTQLPYFTEISLTEFTPQEAQELIQLKLAKLFGEQAHIPAALIGRITERAAGNPFYIDELINYLQDRKVDLSDSEGLAQIDLPASLYSLILSRMDQLTEGQKVVIKVASVIGRLFQGGALLGVYPQLGEREGVLQNLEVLSALELTPLDTPEPELTYIFKHVITQEVAYESLLYRTRAMLHEQIGRYLEEKHVGTVEQYIHLLAHHYDRSENEAKRREYLLRAGDVARADYANTAAIDYYQRLLPLLPSGQQAPVLRKLGHVYELLADWQEAEQRYQQALQLAAEREEQAWCETALAELMRKQGQYEQALAWLDKAEEGFTAVADRAGMGQVWHYRGTIAVQRGENDLARVNYQKSLTLRQEIGDQRQMGNVLNNLGIVARRQGNSQLARAYYQKSLELRREVGDRWGVANALNNMGNASMDLQNYDEARTQLDEALAIQRELGDRWMIGNALNNLGNVVRAQGLFAPAVQLYRESLTIYGALRDKWALAYLFEDVGCLLGQHGRPTAALELVGTAAVLREEIGSPLTATEQTKLTAALAPALAELTAEAQAMAHETGRGRSLTDALLVAADLLAV